MKQFLDFLGVRNEWDDIDVKEHRDISVKLYESGGSDKVGSKKPRKYTFWRKTREMYHCASDYRRNEPKTWQCGPRE